MKNRPRARLARPLLLAGASLATTLVAGCPQPGPFGNLMGGPMDGSSSTPDLRAPEDLSTADLSTADLSDGGQDAATDGPVDARRDGPFGNLIVPLPDLRK